MSGETVYTCAWCGLTAPAEVDESAEYLPKGWDLVDSEELCPGCFVVRSIAISTAKSERKDVNKGRGIAS